jgi:hypothetical protein
MTKITWGALPASHPPERTRDASTGAVSIGTRASADAILVYTAISRCVPSQNLSLFAASGKRRGCFSGLRTWQFRIRKRPPSSLRHDPYVWDRRVHGRS